MPAYSRSDFGPTTQQFDAALTREALPPGTRVGGYQIVDVLGGGAIGIVYLALDLSLQRQVAIKEYLPTSLAQRGDNQHVVMRSGASSSAYIDGLAAFLNQAKLLARFDHPSLVRVHSYWEENRTAYMVMPFYNGQTLAAHLKALDRPPQEVWLRTLLHPLLGALNALHAASCYHRGISPENIVLLPNGQPVLLDFGAATRAVREKSDKKMPRKALLHAGYSPIEQYTEHGEAGPWTDLYALAGVLYYAITKRTPATATARFPTDPQQPLSLVVHAMQPAFPELQYNPTLISAIDKALSVQPNDRPQTVQEFQALIDLAQPRPPAPAPSENEEAVRAAIAAALRSVPGEARQPEPSIKFPSVRESAFMADPAMQASASSTAHRPPAPRRSSAPWIAGLILLAAGTAGVTWWSQSPAGRQFLSGAAPTQAAVPARPTSTRELAGADAASAVTPAMAQAAVVPTPHAAAASAATQATSPSTEVSIDKVAAVSTGPAASAAATESAGTAQAPNTATPAQESSRPVATVNVGSRAPAQAADKLAGKSSEKSAEKAVARKKDELLASAANASPGSAAAAAEPNNPAAMCAPRTNFALVYCMQTQCKRPKFARHAQCDDLRRRGEL